MRLRIICPTLILIFSVLAPPTAALAIRQGTPVQRRIARLKRTERLLHLRVYSLRNRAVRQWKRAERWHASLFLVQNTAILGAVTALGAAGTELLLPSHPDLDFLRTFSTLVSAAATAVLFTVFKGDPVADAGEAAEELAGRSALLRSERLVPLRERIQKLEKTLPPAP